MADEISQDPTPEEHVTPPVPQSPMTPLVAPIPMGSPTVAAAPSSSQQDYTRAQVTTPGAYPGSQASGAGYATYASNFDMPSGGYSQATPQDYYANPAAVKKEKRRTSKGLAFLMGLLGVVIGAALTYGVLLYTTDGFKFSNNISTENPAVVGEGNGAITINPLAEDVSLAEAVATKVLPSVVNIDVYVESDSIGGFFNDGTLGSDSNALQESGLGSGVVITSDGYILTNYHVVEGGAQFIARFDESTQLEATVVGTDPSSDLAVLKVEANGLTPIEVADSSEVNVGEWVMAVGSPFGLEKSVSTGIVSALFRSTTMESTTGVNIYANMIQTDAAINPGNSGGALVNAEGKLIGINTLISSPSGSSSGVGFAIPSNFAKSVAEQIMAGKTVEHAYLGVTLSTVDAASAQRLGTSVDSGAFVESVVAGSPAEQAGIRQGDVIVSFDGTSIASAAQLIISVRGQLVDDEVVMDVVRDDKTLTIDVKLGSDAQANLQ